MHTYTYILVFSQSQSMPRAKDIKGTAPWQQPPEANRRHAPAAKKNGRPPLVHVYMYIRPWALCPMGSVHKAMWSPGEGCSGVIRAPHTPGLNLSHESRHLFSDDFLTSFWYPYFLQFWSQLGPNLAPNLAPKSTKNRSKSLPKSI